MNMQEFGQYQRELHRNIDCPNKILRARAINELKNSMHISMLHQEIEDLPHENDCITTDWHLFPAGTELKTIHNWFAETFRIDF